MKTSFVWIMLLVLLVAGCSERLPERVVNRVLTPEEMAILPGRYQGKTIMVESDLVDMDSPLNEPILEWVYKNEDNYIYDTLVDVEGGVWVTSKNYRTSSGNAVIRLNPDGSVDWERQLLPPGDTLPENYSDFNEEESYDITQRSSILHFLFMTQGGLILKAERVVQHNVYDPELEGLERYKVESEVYMFAEYLDLDGNTVWRTEPIEYSGYNYFIPERISNNRFIFGSGDGGFSIYSLSNGGFLEEVKVSVWSENTLKLPIELEEGGWIVTSIISDSYNPESSIHRLNSDGTYAWTTRFYNSGASACFLEESETLIAATVNGIYLLDMDNGQKSLIYVGPESEFLIIEGETQNGNILITSVNRIDCNSRNLISLSPSGEIISINRISDQYQCIKPIIYRDGAILFGHSLGVILIEPDGNIRWEISLNDLGINPNLVDTMNIISFDCHPTPNGGLCINRFRGMTETEIPDIFYLSPPE